MCDPNFPAAGFAVRVGADPVRAALKTEHPQRRVPQFQVIPVCRDATVPDLVADSALAVWFGIPLLNTTEQRLDSVRLRILFWPTACSPRPL